MEHEESGTPHRHYYFHLTHRHMQYIIDYLGGRAGTVMSTELLTHRLTEQLGRNVRVTSLQIQGEYVEYRLEVELRTRMWRDTMELATRVQPVAEPVIRDDEELQEMLREMREELLGPEPEFDETELDGTDGGYF
jgi:hypothetical protein